MFREGYYLEIIKTKYTAATAVITVQEKTIVIKNKKITTNKWLTLEDWASLYEILEKALIQNNQKKSRSEKEKRKSTRHLEISYTFEASENPSDRTSLPTIRVAISALRKKSKHRVSSSRPKKKSSSLENEDKNNKKSLLIADDLDFKITEDVGKVEEYIPDIPNTKKIINEKGEEDSEKIIGYVPSRKSTLEYLQQSSNSNEYVPAVLSEEGISVGNTLDDLYVPNSIPKTENLCETYEPSSSNIDMDLSGEYVPNSKGAKKKYEEYQPDFIARNKTMKFDDSYVPSSSRTIKELKKNDRKLSFRSGRRVKNREEETATEGSLNKKNSSLVPSEIKREI